MELEEAKKVIADFEKGCIEYEETFEAADVIAKVEAAKAAETAKTDETAKVTE